VDVQAIARRVEEDLAAAEEELHAAQEKVVETQRRVNELHALRDSFALAVERYGDTAPADTEATESAKVGRTQRAARPPRERVKRPRRSTSPEPAPGPEGEQSLADACLAALVSFRRVATTNEVRDKLAESGRPVPVERVRSSLGYLERRAGKIKRVGRAVWEPQG